MEASVVIAKISDAYNASFLNRKANRLPVTPDGHATDSIAMAFTVVFILVNFNKYANEIGINNNFIRLNI